MIFYFLYLCFFIIDIYCVAITAGIIKYMLITYHSTAPYEERWQLFRIGYHIKESGTDIFFKIGYLK